jgi:hypothetical protein
MKEAKDPISETTLHEHNTKNDVKAVEAGCVPSDGFSLASHGDSIHGNLAADTAEPSSERTTSEDLIGFCEKHVVMFLPERCFICESRVRSRNTGELEQQIAQLAKFVELAASLGQKNTEMNERLTGTKLTVDMLSERLRQTRAQLAARDRQIAQLRHEIAVLKAA